MTSRISSKAILLHALGQTIKCYPRRTERTHYRRHIPIPELIGQYQPGFGPYTEHRLITLLPFIGHQGLPLLTLYDCRVLIHRRLLFLWTPSPEFLYPIVTHLSQSSQLLGLLWHVRYLTRQ